MSYDPEAYAELDGTPSDFVAAKLRKNRNTNARLVADFEAKGEWLDIEACQSVELDAWLENGINFQVGLMSSNGAWLEMQQPGQGRKIYPIQLVYPTTPDKNAPLDEDGQSALFDPKQVRYLYIQPDYAANAATTVVVTGVRF